MAIREGQFKSGKSQLPLLNFHSWLGLIMNSIMNQWLSIQMPSQCKILVSSIKPSNMRVGVKKDHYSVLASYLMQAAQWYFIQITAVYLTMVPAKSPLICPRPHCSKSRGNRVDCGLSGFNQISPNPMLTMYSSTNQLLCKLWTMSKNFFPSNNLSNTYMQPHNFHHELQQSKKVLQMLAITYSPKFQ